MEPTFTTKQGQYLAYIDCRKYFLFRFVEKRTPAASG